MTQVPPTIDPNTPVGDPAEPDPAEISRRERATLEATIRDSKLENLMLRTGVDSNEGMGKLFFEGYKGELTVEAVTEAATGYGLLKKPDEKPSGEPGDVTDPDERRQTGERQQAATGSVPDGNAPSKDPRLVAVETGNEVMGAGGTQEAAIGAAFDEIAAAGYGGDGRKPDRRAQWYPGKEDPRRPDLGW